MNSSTAFSSATCLSSAAVQQFLVGDLTPSEVGVIEEHLTECERCRVALEAGVGNEVWWNGIGDSLKTEDSDWQCDQHRSAKSARLLELLGPTDDPDSLGRIGSYEVVGLLGQGGMGAVFKAFDAGLSRYVAIKILLPHLATSEEARQRFAREGKAAAAVIDDHVLPIHAVSEWHGVPYLVAQYTRGMNLQRRLDKNGPLAVTEVLRIGMQTARGLAAAHAQGLVHRDVKLSNILLDGQVDRALLTDFGLARAADDVSMTRTGVVAGTPQYMSPEQAGGSVADHRSDLFSLGSVLYALCTGVPPFRAESSLAVLRLVTDAQPEPIQSITPGVPALLCAIISKLMSRDPDDRFQSASEVAELLQNCLAHVQYPQTTPLPAAIETLQRRRTFSSRRGAMLWISGTLLAAALAVVLLQKNTNQSDSPKSAERTAQTAVTKPEPQTAVTPTQLLEARKALQACQSSLAWMKKFEMKVAWNYSRPELGRIAMTDHIRRDGPRMETLQTVSCEDKPVTFAGSMTSFFLDDGEAFLSRSTSIGQKKLTGGVTVRDRKEHRWKMVEATGNFALEGYCSGNCGKTLMELLLDAKEPRVRIEEVDGSECLRISERNSWGTMAVWIETKGRRLRKLELYKERGQRYSTSRVGKHRDTTAFGSFRTRVDKIRYETIDGSEVAMAGRVRFTMEMNGRGSREWSLGFKRSDVKLSPQFNPKSTFQPDFDEGARISDWDSPNRNDAYRWKGQTLVREK